MESISFPKQVIVIGTRPDRKEQLSNCWDSIKSPYLRIAVDCDGYEIGKIKWVLNHTDFDEFVFIQDSFEVRDNSIFDICFSHTGGVSLCNYPMLLGCYLGKYERKVLEKMSLPDIKTKAEAVDYESRIATEYLKYGSLLEIGGSLRDVDNFVEKFGHKVMKIENEYFIKYKSYWNRSML